MAITVEEKWGRTLDDNSGELVYIIRGTTDPGLARQWLRAQAASSFDGKPIGRAEVDELPGVPEGAFLGRVRYTERANRQQVGQSQFSFETRGERQHISQSIETVSSHAATGQPPDFKGAIGVTQEGKIEGTDITVPVYSFSETHYFSSVSDTYKGTLFSLTGKVNDAAFKGLNAGEALFLGAAGSKRGDDPWQIKFLFAGSPNMSNLSVGDMTGIAKKGWEYLWAQYRTVEQASPKLLVRRPLYAYVEKVYREGDFSQIDIGT
jgi:hypothetical protein